MYVHFPPFAGLVAKQVDTTAVHWVECEGSSRGEKTDVDAGAVILVEQAVVSHPIQRKKVREKYAQGLERFTWE
jgi:hypothetical protein